MLKKIDDWLYLFLKDNVEIMPLRFIKLIANYYTDAKIRKIYWEKLGVSMGKETYANLGLRVVPNQNTVCVEIGNRVSIAPNVMFICEESANNGKEINKISYIKNKLTKSGNIIVEDEVWIGANVTILSGIRIGKCSVIGAGSVVTKDIDPYSVYAGVPAKKIRNLNNECNITPPDKKIIPKKNLEKYAFCI